MILNAENMILGRMATFVAKKALLGEEVDIINIEKALITGKPKELIANYKQKYDRGHAKDGPFFPRDPKKFVKRTIRGMLPYKQERGKLAYKRIKCHVGIPKDFEGKKAETLENADIKKVEKAKYLTIKQITQLLGHER